MNVKQKKTLKIEKPTVGFDINKPFDFVCFEFCTENSKELPRNLTQIKSVIGSLKSLRTEKIKSLRRHPIKRTPDTASLFEGHNNTVYSLDVKSRESKGKGKKRLFYFSDKKEEFYICKIIVLFSERTHS